MYNNVLFEYDGDDVDNFSIILDQPNIKKYTIEVDSEIDIKLLKKNFKTDEIRIY